MTSIHTLWWCVALSVLVLAKTAPRTYTGQDLDTAASGHHHGRVQIKVYRGPDEHHHGHHHEHFAPHGYWIKQPADDHHH